MATEKVSLTLDAKTLREARKRVGRRGLSSFVDDALRIRLQHERIRALLAEYAAESGPIPEAIREEARREWQRGDRIVDARPTPRKRRPRR